MNLNATIDSFWRWMYEAVSQIGTVSIFHDLLFCRGSLSTT